MVLENLRGLTACEAKWALSQAVVAGFKKTFVEKDNLVSYISPEDNLDMIGRLENVKSWVRTRKVAFSAPSAELPTPQKVSAARR